MSVTGSKQTQSRAGSSPRRSPLLMRLLGMIVFGALAIGFLPMLFGVGFVLFIWQLPTREVMITRNADGIVVLTGGPSRIADGIDLLIAGHGRRLLITGVYPTTSPAEIARLAPQAERFFSCCIDLDHEANHTLGNAIETRRWAERNGYRSLIVVTANFHMPRAMAELANQLPGAELVPFPVVTDRLRVDTWWSSRSAAKLLF